MNAKVLTFVLVTALLSACTQADTTNSRSDASQAKPVASEASPSGGAPGSLVNQYRQMGSIAGTAEQCYGSKAIPEAINPQILAAGDSPVMRDLVKEYNAAYGEGVKKQVVWNGAQGAYSTPFDCTSTEDMQMVEGLEESILVSL